MKCISGVHSELQKNKRDLHSRGFCAPWSTLCASERQSWRASGWGARGAARRLYVHGGCNCAARILLASYSGICCADCGCSCESVTCLLGLMCSYGCGLRDRGRTGRPRTKYRGKQGEASKFDTQQESATAPRADRSRTGYRYGRTRRPAVGDRGGYRELQLPGERRTSGLATAELRAHSIEQARQSMCR